MFYKCQYLTDAIFFNVDTSNMIYADSMFAYDTALKDLDLSNWTTVRLNVTSEMFANSGLLKKVYTGDTDQKIPQIESTPTGIYVTPKQAKYLYADPDTDDPDTPHALTLHTTYRDHPPMYPDSGKSGLSHHYHPAVSDNTQERCRF